MTPKTYLNQAYRLEQRIRLQQEELGNLRTLAASVGSPGFEEHYNPNHPNDAPFVKTLDRIWEKEKKVNDEICLLLQLKDEIQSVIDQVDNMDERLILTYDEYVLRLKCLQQLGLPLCVLMQRNAPLDALERYYDLGIRMFTISDDSLAIASKSRHPDISVTLSITSALTESDIKSRDLSMYDHIVLFFWFSRHLDTVKTLPKKYRYILIPNTDCYWNCRWHDAHWFRTLIRTSTLISW